MIRSARPLLLVAMILLAELAGIEARARKRAPVRFERSSTPSCNGDDSMI